MDAVNLIIQIALILTIALLSIRISILEHNFNAIKEWLKVLRIIDLDKVTKAVREYQEKDG